MMSQFFETERLIVRGIEFEDLDAFAELCADPIAMQYMGDGKILDRETVERWIGICHDKYQQRGYGTSALVEKESGKFIGFCGVVRAPDTDFDEIVYAFSQAVWGKGYATEAALAMLDYVFSISELSEIYATIHAKNAASLKMMAKLKMNYQKSVTEEDGQVTNYYLIRRN
jgi:[ribosomal protein S5]-alanine N-acetyltransferase